MLLKTFLYVGFVNEFLEAASEQVFEGFDMLINSFLKSKEFIAEKKWLFQYSVIPFLIDHIENEQNIEALYIKINIFTEVFYGVYGDEDNSDSNSEEENTQDLNPENDSDKSLLAEKIYRMCFNLMKHEDNQIFAFCSKLMRQLFQRVVYKLDNNSASELMKVLCEKIMNESDNKSENSDDDEEEEQPEVLSVNLFGLIFYALAQDSDLVYGFIDIDILSKILDLLMEYDNGEPIDEVFGVLNLIVEILYKFAKTDSLDRVVVFSGSVLSELLTYFLNLKNIASFGEIYVDEVMNIIYYISRIICLGKKHSKISLDEKIDLKSFDWALLTSLDQNLDKQALKTRKKINKLRRMIK